MRAEAQAHIDQINAALGAAPPVPRLGPRAAPPRRAERAGRGSDTVGRSQGGAGRDARAPPARRGDRRDPGDRAGARRHDRADGDGRRRGRRGDGRRGRRQLGASLPSAPSSDKVEALLSGEADANDTYVEINAGAGGTESQDWAEMLLRMYTRWAERHGFKVELIEDHAGEQAGIKSATLLIKGDERLWLAEDREPACTGWCASRPSTATRAATPASPRVWVYPVVDDNIDIEINESDLRIDTYRASGAGGQHVNTTDSRGAHHPPADRHRRRRARTSARSTRTAPTAMDDAEGAALRGGAAEARGGGAAATAGDQDRHRLGPPDPLLRAAALSAGEGPAHRRRPRPRRRDVLDGDLDRVHGGGALAAGDRRDRSRSRSRGSRTAALACGCWSLSLAGCRAPSRGEPPFPAGEPAESPDTSSAPFPPKTRATASAKPSRSFACAGIKPGQ